MRYLIVLALLAGCYGCRGAKESAQANTHDAQLEISAARGDVGAADATLEAAEPTAEGTPLELPVTSARKRLASADTHLERAGAKTTAVLGNLEGVKNKRSLFARFFGWLPLALPVLGVVALIYLGGWPIVVAALRWLRRRGKALSGRVVARAELLHKTRADAQGTPAHRRLDATIAHERADPHFDAAWRLVAEAKEPPR